LRVPVRCRGIGRRGGTGVHLTGSTAEPTRNSIMHAGSTTVTSSTSGRTVIASAGTPTWPGSSMALPPTAGPDASAAVPRIPRNFCCQIQGGKAAAIRCLLWHCCAVDPPRCGTGADRPPRELYRNPLSVERLPIGTPGADPLARPLPPLVAHPLPAETKKQTGPPLSPSGKGTPVVRPVRRGAGLEARGADVRELRAVAVIRQSGGIRDEAAAQPRGSPATRLRDSQD
jgi:hypothetical protein